MNAPLTCKELIDFLDDYVAGEVDAGLLERFEWHLARCESCVAYLHSYRATIRLARGTAIEDVPPDVITAILATVIGSK